MSFNNTSKIQRFCTVFGIVSGLFLTSCGLSGGSGSINEGIPSNWTPLATAVLTSLGSYDVSGQAILYKDAATNRNYIRLEGLSTPTGTTLYLSANYTGGPAFTSTYIGLHGHSGNQNYTTNIISANGNGWVSVSIVSLNTGSTVTYATAAFNK
ncbi:hypothetical protein K2X30_01285 [bacterium]|jgi:hypothetical protein|nr:hypothetical protein [bacterium]